MEFQLIILFIEVVLVVTEILKINHYKLLLSKSASLLTQHNPKNEKFELIKGIY